MAEAKGGALGRAVRGIEAAAFVLRHAFGAYAVVGGEGARRLGDALAGQAGEPGSKKLEGHGLEAARAAVGSAAAGQRTAVLASGPAVLEALPAVREMVRLGLPVVIVVPSHGEAQGGTLPDPTPEDLAHLLSLPLGVLMACDATQVADFTLAALRAATDRGAPWVVGFELAAVGLALGNARLPEAEQVRAWAAEARTDGARPDGAGVLTDPARDLEHYRRDVERYAFAIAAAMRELERLLRRPVAPVITDGVRDAEVVVVSAGAAARAARHAVPHMHQGAGRRVGALQVASLRPFPAAEVVRLSWRASAVVVHEPFAEPLGTGGTLSDAVRASFADALTWHPAFAGIGRIPPVVTVLGADVSPDQWVALARRVSEAADPPRLLAPVATPHGGDAESRIEIMMDEAGREEALRLVVDWLARTGTTVAAHAHEPARTGLSLGGAGGRGPSHILVACGDGGYEASRIESLPPGALVVLAGDFPDRVLAETMRAAAVRGVRVAHLGGHGAPVGASVALASVLRALLPLDAASEAALASAVQESGHDDAPALLEQVRTLGNALRAQLG